MTTAEVPEKDPMVSTREVASTFAVTTETVRNWIDRGVIKHAVKVGTQYRIPRSEVIRLAKEKYGD